MTSVAEKIQNSAGPIDRLAARVIKKAKPEEVWMPKPKFLSHIARSENVLHTAEIPKLASHMAHVIGQRRGRLVILGYAKDQGSGNKGARWVVRCDCGNFECRTRILRWIGTAAPDMCSECRLREFKIKGEFFPREKAERKTLAALSGDAP